jgi:multiple sugar transport system substrate-binding protein
VRILVAIMTASDENRLDELITHVRSGRMKRRTFLSYALALGLTSTSASSILAACGGSSDSSGGNSAALNIIWQGDHDNTGFLHQSLVDTFNKTNRSGIHVTYIDGPDNTDQQHNIFLNMLSTRSGSVDILSMDITWPAEFALNQWITPITDLWPASERNHYLPGPIKGCTVGDQIWAAPLRTDVGVLFYRTDIISAPPRTWSDLTNLARSAQSKAGIKYGYVWQGASYEGLVCDFVEVLYGYNGSVLDANNPQLVTINSPEAAEALSMMVSWLNTISPSAVTHFLEND